MSLGEGLPGVAAVDRWRGVDYVRFDLGLDGGNHK